MSYGIFGKDSLYWEEGDKLIIRVSDLSGNPLEADEALKRQSIVLATF